MWHANLVKWPSCVILVINICMHIFVENETLPLHFYITLISQLRPLITYYGIDTHIFNGAISRLFRERQQSTTRYHRVSSQPEFY
jgi:hypothetical protein